MRKVVVLMAVVGLVAPVLGASFVRPGVESGSYVVNLDGSLAPEQSTRVVNENYDNWRAAAQGGQSALLGLYKNGASEIADDLTMVNVGAGWLDTLGFAVANVDAPSGLVTGQGAIRFYDLLTNTFISGFNFNLPTFSTPLAAGSSSRISFAADALLSLNIFLPATGVYASVQWTSATFNGTGDLSNMGIQLRGPINTGSSTDNLYDVAGGFTAFNFSGNPLANTAFFIKCEDTPEPATLALLALGLLLRRR